MNFFCSHKDICTLWLLILTNMLNEHKVDNKHGGYLGNCDSYLLFMLFYKYNHSWDILYLDYFGLSLNAILIAYVIMKTPYYEIFVCCMTFVCVL
jgi:hypothetical protein